MFTLFPKLPSELRDKIWIHTVDWEAHVLPRPPITELSVCHEARAILLLKIYRPCFKPGPRHRLDDTLWSVGTRRDSRFIVLTGMGSWSPRSPYANYKTDVLRIDESWLYEKGQRTCSRDSLENFISAEALDDLQLAVIAPRLWAPRFHGGPMRRVGDPPRPPRPEAELIVTYLKSLRMLYFAEDPSVRIDIPPRVEDETPEQRVARGGRARPDDEILIREKLALKVRYAEGKMLIPSLEIIKFTQPGFKIERAEQWLDRKATELPGWKAPEVQCATIVPDPWG